MEIGQHRAGAAERETGIDEQVGFRSGGAFDGPNAGGADGDDSLAWSMALKRLLWDRERLVMKMNVFDHVGVERLKCSQADVQSDVSDRGAGGSAGFQNFRREMQTGGGRGRGASFAGEDGLIALAIGSGVGAADIGRQRHVARALQHFIQIATRVKADGALAMLAAAEDFGGQFVGDHDAFAGAHFLARADQGFPGEVVWRRRSGEKNFYSTGGMFAMAVEARREARGSR